MDNLQTNNASEHTSRVEDRAQAGNPEPSGRVEQGMSPARRISENQGQQPRERSASAFQNSAAAGKYWIILGVLAVIAAGCGFGLLAYGNPMPVGTEQFWLIAERRMNSVIAMAVVAICQAMATVAFHHNLRLIT